jgi:NADPH:quinone reductase
MKAAYVNQPGDPASIVYGDLPTPKPGPAQCLVRVGAVSVNPVDTYIRGGQVQMPLPSPFILGCDLAGTIVEVGPDVTNFNPGDRVWGTNQGLLGRQGTFAEFAAVDEWWLYPTPANVSDEQAAALSLVAITAHLGLVRDAQLRSGETLFVNGGSGGNEQKAELCQKLGADHVILYKSAGVAGPLKKIAPTGVHVWWETLREPDFDLAIGALAARGRMVVMAGRDARPPFPVGTFYVKGCSLHGFVMFLATPEEQQSCAEDINQWMGQGRLKANIDRVLPLSAAGEAHELQEQSTIKQTGALHGKIVLKP